MIENLAESGKDYLPLVQQLKSLRGETAEPKSQSFVDSLKEFVRDANDEIKRADDLTEAFVKGEPVDLHDVMIAAEKAKTSFQLLLQIRSKFLDMYREINRTQI